MKIRKSSWHYRLYSFCTREIVPGEEPVTICGYLGVFLKVALPLLFMAVTLGTMIGPWPVCAGIAIAAIACLLWNLHSDGKLDGLYAKFGPLRRKICAPIEII